MTTTTLSIVDRPQVVGTCRLADTLRATLPPAKPIASLQSGAMVGRLTVVADPRLDLDALLAVQADAISAGRDVVPVRVVGPSVEVGPRTSPGRAGCVRCGVIRHRAVLRSGLMHPYLATEPPRAPLPDRWLQVVAHAVGALARGELPADTVLVVSPVDGELTRHRITPVPGCPGCAPLPLDSAATAWTEPKPRPQSDPFALRTKPLLDASTLTAELADHRYGPVLQTYRDPVAPTAFVGVELVMPSGGRMWGYGRAADYDRAKAIGLLEAIERETGSAPAARRTAIAGSYADLAQHAIDPATLGLSDPAYHGHPHSLLDAYTPDTLTFSTPQTFISYAPTPRIDLCIPPLSASTFVRFIKNASIRIQRLHESIY